MSTYEEEDLAVLWLNVLGFRDDEITCKPSEFARVAKFMSDYGLDDAMIVSWFRSFSNHLEDIPLGCLADGMFEEVMMAADAYCEAEPASAFKKLIASQTEIGGKAIKAIRASRQPTGTVIPFPSSEFERRQRRARRK